MYLRESLGLLRNHPACGDLPIANIQPEMIGNEEYLFNVLSPTSKTFIHTEYSDVGSCHFQHCSKY
jgi:hypothetical protein